MDDPLNPFARQSAHELIVAKRDRLLAERKELIAQRAALLSKIRRADRELADCRAAARLFELDIPFPDDDEDERMLEARRRRDLERQREYHFVMGSRRSVEEQPREASQAEIKAIAVPAPFLEFQASAPEAHPRPIAEKRPPLREVILEQLYRAGETGRKAAEMREFIERTFGEIIHEKTVGMTLYRMSKAGLAYREGHNWYIGSARPETKGPQPTI